VLSRQPESAVSWHSGFRRGVHARRATGESSSRCSAVRRWRVRSRLLRTRMRLQDSRRPFASIPMRGAERHPRVPGFATAEYGRDTMLVRAVGGNEITQVAFLAKFSPAFGAGEHPKKNIMEERPDEPAR
jgi:hypothetical protein